LSNIYPKFQFEDKRVEKFSSEQVNLKWFKTYEHFLFEETGEGKHCDPVMILAHEFFDALPVNLFQYSNK
jgi:NADH dehydrogenase [ubiquinone] 1 alpha subcomplex assembly factor 7